MTFHLCREHERRAAERAPVLLLKQRSAVRSLIRRNDHRRRYPVAALNIQQSHSLGGTPGLADGFRVHANDLAVLANQHHLGIFTHLGDANDFAIALRRFHVNDALGPAMAQTVFIRRSSLAVAILSDGKNQRSFDRDGFVGGGRFRNTSFHFGLLGLSFGFLDVLRRNRHAHDVILLFEVHATHSGSIAAHGADFVLVETHRHAFVRCQEDDLLAIGERRGYQFVAAVDVDGDDAAGHHVAEVFYFRLLYRAVAGGEKDVPVLFLQVADREHGANALARLERNEVADMFTLAGGADIRNLVNLQPVNPPGIGEDENVGVGGGDEQMLDEILVARLHAGTAGASATLHAVGGDRCALQIAGVADRDRHLLVGDQIFQMDLSRFVFNHGTTLIAVLFLHFFEFLHDDAAKFLFRSQNRFELRDVL